MYKSQLLEVPQIQEALDTLNEEGAELISLVNIADTSQLLIVYKEDSKKKMMSWLKVDKEEEDDET